jgi:transcriptional regulator with XRE-family HTH domain
MSQYTLARVTDLDRTYISLLERGLRSPSLDTMLALARGLNVSLVEISAAVEASLLTGPPNA